MLIPLLRCRKKRGRVTLPRGPISSFPLERDSDASELLLSMLGTSEAKDASSVSVNFLSGGEHELSDEHAVDGVLAPNTRGSRRVIATQL